MGQPTLFEGKLSLIFWTPNSVTETSIGQMADTIKNGAPNVTGVMVKTNNGSFWQGAIDSNKPDLAINSAADIRRWVDTLGARGLDFHAWGVVRGLNATAEINRFVEVCQVAGVKSLSIDLEPGDFYFVGTEAVARTIATGIRQRVGANFHVGLIFDYRGNRPQQLWVQSVWFPEIDSLHPMVYHYHFGQSATTALQNCYNTIGSWGRPVYPMLQGYSPGGTIGLYPASDIPVTAGIAVNTFKAKGLSWYRYGKGLSIPDEGLGPADLAQVAKVPRPTGSAVVTPPPSSQPPVVIRPPQPADSPAREIIIDPNNERTGEFSIHYYDGPAVLSRGWNVAVDNQGRPFAYRNAVYNNQTLYVTYQPRILGKGRYVLEAYIPDNHAYTPDAHYIVVDYPNGQRRETTCVLNQSIYTNEWAPLRGTVVNGVPNQPLVEQFDLTPTQGDSGRVNVADITFINPASHASGKFELTFGALRWRPVATVTPVQVATGLDSPVGTDAERAAAIGDGRRTGGGYMYWCGKWFDVNPIGSRYWLGNRWAIHTGSDLNLDGGSVIADKDAPIYAIGDGKVLWARRLSSGWGNVIVIEHAVPGESRVVWARYAHLTDLTVTEGQDVRRGQRIAAIGEYAPNNYHLHFDIALDPVLKTTPGHWPGDNLAGVLAVYTDPLAFIKKYHTVR